MKRVASLFLVLGLLTDAHPSQSAGWNGLTSLPQARFGAAAAASGNRFYVLGGFSSQISADVETWDGSVWSFGTPMHMARMMPGAAEAGGQVFAIGGIDATGLTTAAGERLDPTSGTWTDIAAMPMPRSSFAIGSIGGQLFVAGGQGQEGTPVAESFRYDPGANAWTPIAAIPTPRSGVCGAVLDNRLWVMGGSNGAPSAAVERFDPLTGGWSSAPPLPEPLWFPAAGVLNGRVWVVGGMDGSFQRCDRAYSAGSDGAWQAEAVLPAALAVSAAGTFGNCLVVAGGMDASGLPTTLAFSQCTEASPPPPPPSPSDPQVSVTVNPSPLNASSQGQWISVHIVPNGWPATDIVVASLRLDGIAPDMNGPVTVSEAELVVKFPRLGFANRPAGEYHLVLTGLRSDGSSFEGEAALTVQGTMLQDKRHALRPLATGPATGIVVSLDQPESVQLDVIDLQGRIVERLHQGQLGAGEFRLPWPAAGQSVPRGTYFVRLRRPGAVDVMRIAVLR